MSELVFIPLVSWPVLAVFAVVSLVVCMYAVWRSPFSGVLRLMAALGLLALLTGPTLLEETTSPLPDIALIIEDQSSSQKLDGREEVTAAAATELASRLEGISDLDVRRVTLAGRDETRLGEGFLDGLSDVPRSQLAGIFVVTDGQSIDTPQDPATLGINAPVHTLLTGRPGETDRTLEIVSEPRFGIINEVADIVFKVEDYGFTDRLASVSLKVNGREAITRTVRVGEEVPLQAALDTPGKTIIELSTLPVDGELTTRNNRAVIEISVIRDRLRVLLVSGEPHAGERVWRNLLKSDPAVDLIHFTILKPSTKPLVASEDDLALIRFPENELFLEKLDQFDVLIFDRYTYRGVISALHFDNISRYIQNGGAMLIASGPEFIGSTSIATRRNLAFILPALPNGNIDNAPYLPTVSQTGLRHPVTGTLQGAGDWGRWLRSLGVNLRGGDVLLEREDGAPLLVVNRVEQGRVGLLLSDHVWLWARDFDGGGPHRELLRRLVHWLMKEPELEEEAVTLRSDASRDEIAISRRTLQDEVSPVFIEGPDGSMERVELVQTENGAWAGRVTATESGLYTATTGTDDGRTLFDVVALGLAAPPEYKHVISSAEHLQPLVSATGGGIYNIRTRDGLRIPSIRQVREGRPATARSGDSGWAGIYRRDAARVENVSTRDILPAWLWLLLVAGLVLTGWLQESGRLRQKQSATD
ncbi:hypothetical protein [Parvularcula sp. IMCC14364]|uniref:hypothetical protein n=1 Tax=Parvularcula sp. IMCC14364 TaxID=3067902 RepID=UPI0027410DB7|nr:hypothetical protein [Parvularcula sp. IMCC14364]